MQAFFTLSSFLFYQIFWRLVYDKTVVYNIYRVKSARVAQRLSSVHSISSLRPSRIYDVRYTFPYILPQGWWHRLCILSNAVSKEHRKQQQIQIAQWVQSKQFIVVIGRLFQIAVALNVCVCVCERIECMALDIS